MNLQCQFSKTASRQKFICRASASDGNRPERRAASGVWSHRRQSCVGVICYADHLGTPRAITRPSDNAVVWKWENSDPFGANAPNEDPANTGTAFKYNLRFPGQYYDQETQTHYNYFRDYDPSTGRYVQSDPIGLRGGSNTYAYSNTSPISNRDRFGLACPADLKNTGRCLDSSNFDNNRDGNRSVSTPGLDTTAQNNMRTLDTSDNEENFATMKLPNTFTRVQGSGEVSNDGSYKGTFSIIRGSADAICHSHPKVGFWFGPGLGDNLVVENGYPNYIIQSGKIGVVEIVDGQYQFRLIQGSMTQAEKRETRKQLNSFQEGARR